jgi:hypothetical protein
MPDALRRIRKVDTTMRRRNLDSFSADGILDGSTAPDDVAPGYAGVHDLLRKAAAARTDSHDADTASSQGSQLEAATVAAMRAAALGRVVPVRAASQGSEPDTKRLLSRFVAPRSAAVAVAVVLGAGTASAALTGNLLPGSSGSRSPEAGKSQSSGAETNGASTTGSTTGQQPDDQANGSGQQGSGKPSSGEHSTTSGSLPTTGPANVHAQFGLCTAFLAQVGGPSTDFENSTAFQALMAEHGGTVASTTSFCQSYVATQHPGEGSSSDSSQGGSGDATEPGDVTVPGDTSGSPGSGSSGPGKSNSGHGGTDDTPDTSTTSTTGSSGSTGETS